MGSAFRFRREPIYHATRLDCIRVRGEIGERIDLTIEKNLLALDLKNDFLAPFQKRNGAGYIGFGKTLEGIVHFAFARQTPVLLRLKEEVTDALLASRDSDGHIGTMTGG